MRHKSLNLIVQLVLIELLVSIKCFTFDCRLPYLGYNFTSFSLFLQRFYFELTKIKIIICILRLYVSTFINK